MKVQKRYFQYTISNDLGVYNLETDTTGVYIVSFSALGYKTHNISVEITPKLQKKNKYCTRGKGV